MECEFFGIDCPANKLVMSSWNINGVTNKLENEYVKTWVHKSDIVFLNETKTGLTFNVPGYVTYKDSNKDRSRGGTAVLIRNSVKNLIKNIDVSIEGQVWIELSVLSKVQIGGCYIPPPDSPYFDMLSFAKIQEHCLETPYKSIILGDLNGRCGKAVHSLPSEQDCTYLIEMLPDPVTKPLSNGNDVLQLCQDAGMIVLNNLCYKGDISRFQSKCTYRKGDKWISELDLCLVHPELLPMIESLRIGNEHLPSDHALITVTVDLEKCAADRLPDIFSSALELGEHAVLYSQKNRNICKKPIKEIDIECYQRKLIEIYYMRLQKNVRFNTLRRTNR